MSGAGALYDRIGSTYARTRRADPRIAAQIHAALGPGRRVVNVGAGTGSYEPTDRLVVAVEPSPAMVAQRPVPRVPVVRAVAEQLPLASQSFDVAMAVLTVHHWRHQEAGLAEMARVAGRQVVLFFEALATHTFWGLEYWPEAKALPTEVDPPGEALLRRVLDVRDVQAVMVPPDCVDGFGTAFWCRPEAYLDPEVQAGMSWLAMLPAEVRERGTAQLQADLADGTWERRHGHLRDAPHFDGGYRLAIAGH